MEQEQKTWGGKREVASIGGDKGIHSQGFFYVGSDCYKEIMRRIKEGGETIEVEFNE